MKVVKHNRNYSIFKKYSSVKVCIVAQSWEEYHKIINTLIKLNLREHYYYQFLRSKSATRNSNRNHYFGFFDESLISLILLSVGTNETKNN